MKEFRVGIDSYAVLPLGLAPVEVLEWAAAHGAAGVQFSGLELPEGWEVDDALLEDIRQAAQERGLYVEWGGGQHIPFDLKTWQRRELEPIVRRAAEQARKVGADVIRSCSGGLMRWDDGAPATEALLREAAGALRGLMPVLESYGVTLAIELHFEFTTFELLRLFEMCEAQPGGCVGICLDTMNLLTMLEDPVLGTERVLPWVVATHAKDGSVALTERGLTSFTAEVGTGSVDWENVLARLLRLERLPHLSIEDHGGSFDLPIFDPVFLSRFPDVTAGELARLLKLAQENANRAPGRRAAPLARNEWPGQCEARVARGIENLRGIAKRVVATEAGAAGGTR